MHGKGIKFIHVFNMTSRKQGEYYTFAFANLTADEEMIHNYDKIYPAEKDGLPKLLLLQPFNIQDFLFIYMGIQRDFIFQGFNLYHMGNKITELSSRKSYTLTLLSRQNEINLWNGIGHRNKNHVTDIFIVKISKYK